MAKVMSVRRCSAIKKLIALGLVCMMPFAMAHAAGCKVGGYYPYVSNDSCPEALRLFLEEVGACNHYARRGEAEARAAFRERQCDTLIHEEEAVVIAYEDHPHAMAILNDYFTTHDLDVDFPKGDVNLSVNCSVEGAFPYETQATCPDIVRDYLQRTGDCAHFEGEEATDEDREAFLQDAMQQLRCDRLAQDYTEIWSRYEGDVMLFRLLEAYHETYQIPQPQRLHYE